MTPSPKTPTHGTAWHGLQDGLGFTALNVACRHGQQQVAAVLLEAHADMQLPAASGHTPLMSAALFAEYEDVLQRTTLFDGCRLSAAERDELLDIFMSHCIWTRVYYLWRPNLPDEGDNHLIELAVAGGVRHVVTKNRRDLQRMELRFPGLHIVLPEDFLKELP